jgi:S1-C subfamily serine protease
MGTRLSLVRDSFPNVIQTDMRPNPDQIGGPVVNLKGQVVGITMARADRTRSFIMPSAAVLSMLAKPPADPATVAALPKNQPDGAPGGMARGPRGQLPPGIAPPEPDRLRRHADEMRQLMDRLREEFEQMEELNR